jgi:hypothetical protein
MHDEEMFAQALERNKQGLCAIEGCGHELQDADKLPNQLRAEEEYRTVFPKDHDRGTPRVLICDECWRRGIRKHADDIYEEQHD